MTSTELVPYDELIETKWYKGFLSLDPGLMQMMTGVVFGLHSDVAMPTICTFFRGMDTPVFCNEDCTRLRLILPHLSRSLGVMQRLRSAELTIATTFAALDRLTSGVLLTDAAGCVTFANRRAQCILSEDNGLCLTGNNSAGQMVRLSAFHHADTESIAQAIAASLNPRTAPHFSQNIKIMQRSGNASYTLHFSALGKNCEYNSSVIIFINDSTKRISVDPAALQQSYALTPTESRVAITLLDCATADEVSREMGISVATVRTHMRQIYAKLGVNNRAHFVKLMLGLVVKG